MWELNPIISHKYKIHRARFYWIGYIKKGASPIFSHDKFSYILDAY